MPRIRRLEVLTRMERSGLVPVFFTRDIEQAKGILRACAEGGVDCLEMTNRGDGAIDVFRELEALCTREYPDLVLGTGSVVDAQTAALYIDYGSNFIVGPLLDEETAYLCNSRKVPYMPGCGTVSEIHRAERLGVEICKIFPGAEVGGPSFVKAVMGPCPWTSLMPTGGVAPARDSLTEWFKAGIVAAGIGSNLITSEILETGDFAALTRKVKETLELIRQIRST